MKLAAYQAPVLDIGSMAALALIERRVRWCATEAVDILCCPEAILGGLADDASRPFELALSVESGQLRAVLAPLASSTVTTIIGFTELAADGALYNSAAILTAGEIAGVYRKRHPAIRSSVYKAGDQSPVFSIGDWRFGIMICNDSNFPALGADMVERGARALFVPSNNALPVAKAEILAATRATDISTAQTNGVSIIRADVAGRLDGRISVGSSAIIDASGTVLQAGSRLSEEMLIAER
ncbi:MAG: carbon-nitrogen hydrolase family protein [Devosia sp.]